MKSIIHRSFACIMDHESKAARDGRNKSMDEMLNKQIRGYSIKHAARMKETIGNGGLYKYKKHIEAGTSILP